MSVGSERGALRKYLLPYILIMSPQYQLAKDGMNYASPFAFMMLRFVIAAVALFVIQRKFRLILNRDTILLSVFTWASTALWILGLNLVPPDESAVLSFTMPLFAIPLSALILKERSTRTEWLGAVIGFSGIAVYAIPSISEFGTATGVLLTISNAVFWGLFSIYFRKLSYQDSLGTVGTQFFVGGIIFAGLSPIGFRLIPTPNFLLELSYVSLVSGAFAVYMWNAMARSEKIGRLTVLTYAIPVVAVILQIFETGSFPGAISIAGIGLIFLGIYTSRFRGSKKTVPPYQPVLIADDDSCKKRKSSEGKTTKS